MHNFSNVIVQYKCVIPMPEHSLGPLAHMAGMKTDFRFDTSFAFEVKAVHLICPAILVLVIPLELTYSRTRLRYSEWLPITPNNPQSPLVIHHHTSCTLWHGAIYPLVGFQPPPSALPLYSGLRCTACCSECYSRIYTLK